MLVSYNWLQEHFSNKLPPVKKLVDLLTLGAYEIEEFKKKGNDIVIDVDVLPNRNHDSLCHSGIAREIGVLLDIEYKDKTFDSTLKIYDKPTNLTVSIENTQHCPRYMGRIVKNISVGDSPEWLKNYLEILGQRSINIVVDITNYVMLETGQPMHAFDADKLDGEEIYIRNSREGEKITTLDNQDIVLDVDTFIIADSKNPLAIAGIKGGRAAEVDSNTKNIILESANFNPVLVRKMSRKINIKTDSSKRFENGITPELTAKAMEMSSQLIAKYCGNKAIFHREVDEYKMRPNPHKVGVTAKDVNRLLGSTLTDVDMKKILNQLKFSFEIVKSPTKKILETARALVGAKYIYGASVTFNAPRAFDCSSFTAYAYVQAGIAIPRMAIDQYVFGEEIPLNDIKAGDIIFSNTGIGKSYTESIDWMVGTKINKPLDHCGIYLGDGKIIHASRNNGKDGSVEIEKLNESESFKNVVGIRRIITEENNTIRYVVTAPVERLDIRICEDLIEEIGRVYGYENIENQSLDNNIAIIDKTFYYENLIRNMLVENGFSEVLTYAFTKKGDIEVANPIAKDKNFLRNSLLLGFEKAIDLNLRNSNLLGLSIVRIFEIGTVFTKKSEKRVLGIGLMMSKSYMGSDKKQFKNQPETITESIVDYISKNLNVKVKGDIKITQNGGVILEVDLKQLFKQLPDIEKYGDVLNSSMKTSVFTAISPYPYMTRDIAVFVPEDVSKVDIENILIEKGKDLIVNKPKLFDVFTKTFDNGNKKTSYAYRLVFQSHKKTLTDDEVNTIMDKIYKELKEKSGWEIR